MKKIYFLVTSLLLFTGYAAKSQCTFASQFGSATLTGTNTILTISGCSFAGEFSPINGAVAGQTLNFTSSVSTDWITIHSGTSNGPVIAFGQTPLSFVNTFTGTLYAHWSTNNTCGTQNNCRTTTVQCTSCSGPPDPCLSIVNIPACATPVTSVHSGAGSWNVTTCGFSTPGQERVYTFTPATTGIYNLNVTAAAGGFVDYFYKPVSAGCGPAGWICIDDNAGVGTDLIGVLTGGTQYYILLDPEGTGSFTHTFNISCAIVGPVNDLCAGALPLPCNGSVTSTTVGSTIDAVPTCVTTLNTAGGVWYTFVGNGAPNTISTCTGTTYDSKIGVFSGTCAGLVCVTGNDDNGPACGGLQASVAFTATAGVTYYVLVTGFGTATGAFTLTRTSVAPNDLCTGAININCGQTITGSTACGASIDAVATCVTSLNTAPGLWYRFVGDASPVTLSLCGSSYDTKIGVFTGTCTGLVCVTGNDDFGACGLQSQVTFATNAGFTYYILVTGFGANTGNFTLTRTCAAVCAGVPSPGSITPVTSTVCRSTNVTLTAAGFSPNSGLNFQWNQAPAAAGPFSPIAGAVSNVYTAAPTVTTYYTVTVACSVGGGAATTSPPVVINVDGISHVNVSATPSTLCAGSSTAITGTAVNGITLSSMVVVANSGTINLGIPDNNPTGASHTMAVPAGIISNIPADLRVRVNMVHTWVGDIAIRITSPCGTTFLFDRPGTTGAGFGNADDVNGVYTFDVAVAPIIPEASVGGLVPPGSYRPSDAAGAGNPTWSPLTFACAATGNWTITGIDAAGGDIGTIRDWQILAPSPSNYTHTLTGGAGTITQNASTGVANATGNFTVSAIPAGNHTFTLTSTDPFGCSIASPVNITVNPIPLITFSPAAATICNGQIQQINVYAAPGGILQTFSNNSTTTINAVGNANPYPSVIGVAGLPAAGVSVRSVQVNNFNHTFPDDVDLVLVSPSGTQQVILMSDAGGSISATGQNFNFSDAAVANLADNAFNNTGNYRPTNHPANPDNFPTPGPGSLTQPLNPLLSTFTGNANGNWSLYAVDDLGGDAGLIGGWSITFDVPAPVVLTQSPATPNTIFTNAAATIPYVAGTPVYTVWVNPTVTTTYTGNASALGCNAVATNMIVTVNQLPSIVTQPSPATQTVCPGFTVTYTVVAGGTGPFTYQWRRNGVALTNGFFISGVTTPTLTIANVQVANAGTYDVVVSGVCAPPAVSNGAVLNVGSAPTITTQPVNTTVCEGSNATLSVVAAGTPTPNIFQWQVSTDGGATWTNLTTGGSFTATLTLSNVTLSMNNNRYRVIVTNSCGMTITSSVITLTVNARPVVTVAALPTRICLSDTLVSLVGSPTGGSWTGVGVSGFNFVPTATAVGTYTLTYSFTSAAGCTNTATAVAKVEDCPERIRLLSDDGVILYPNPNNGIFSIRINSTLYNFLGMKVYDMAGRLVNGKVVKNGTDQALVSPVFSGLVYGRVVPIDLSYLPSGMYLVKFYYDDGIRSSEKGFLVSIMK